MFLQIPIGIFTTSIATVVFPKMSRQAAQGDRQGLGDSVSYGIQFLIVLLVPSTVLLCLFGREIIAATMQRGRFSPQNTIMASRALTGYAVGLLGMGLYAFLQKLFNSLKSLVVPLASAGFIAAVDIGLSLILKETPLRVSGLAYANSISFAAGTVLLVALARRKLGAFRLTPIISIAGKSVLGTLPMTALLVLLRRLQPDLWMQGGSARGTLMIAAVVAACILLTLLSYAALRIPFLSELLHRRRPA
jgi:putative peptidoglycan lipid II flippase